MLPGRLQLCKSCWCSMIRSKAAARKTLYQFPDARCHLRHQQCLDGAKVVFLAQWFGSSRAWIPDHQLKTYSEQLQNKHQTNALKHKQSEIWSFRPQYSRFESPSRCLRYNKEWTEWKNWKTRNHQMNHLSLPFIGFICKISPSRLAGNNHQQPSQQCSLFAGPCSSNSGQVSTYGGVA